VNLALADGPGQFRSSVGIPDLEIDTLFREKTLIYSPVKREPLDPEGRSTPDNLLHTVPLFSKNHIDSRIWFKQRTAE
jgi:hypothetical protein